MTKTASGHFCMAGIVPGIILALMFGIAIVLLFLVPDVALWLPHTMIGR